MIVDSGVSLIDVPLVLEFYHGGMSGCAVRFNRTLATYPNGNLCVVRSLAPFRSRPILLILLIACAGEMIFSLPFHLVRFFRPFFLDAFSLSNRQLGDLFAAYGVIAMLSYFPGGLIADRFSSRVLMSVSLLATAAGGVLLLLSTDARGLLIVYLIWGLTTILLFWAAMIRTTRALAGPLTQGVSFGLLDGVRGLVAAGAASIAVLVFSSSIQGPSAELSHDDTVTALRAVITFYTGLTAAIAVALFALLPRDERVEASATGVNFQLASDRRVLFQAAIIFCAYCGYKGLDFYTLYFVSALDYNGVEAAQLQANLAYLRPVAAISAGLVADRYRASRVITIAFMVLAGAYLAAGMLPARSDSATLIVINIALTSFAVFALRGVYFALVDEADVAFRTTGLAVGIVSTVGFLPDIFFAPVAGRIIDLNPGIVGFQIFFGALAGLALLGGVCAFLLARAVHRGESPA